MSFSIENKPSYPTAPARVTVQIAKSSTKPQPAGSSDTYASSPSELQTDVLALRRYAARNASVRNGSLPQGWTHTVAPNGQSTYSNTNPNFDPAFHPKVTYQPVPRPVINNHTPAQVQSKQAEAPAGRTPRHIVSEPPAKLTPPHRTPKVATAQTPAVPRQQVAPRSEEVQLNLVDKVYEKTAGARMEMGNTERICLWYAKDIYNKLMDQKDAGKLPDFQPRIYGWELPADAQFGEAGARLGKTEDKNYAHNLAVLEDKEGNIVRVLDPWQTGPLWSDSLTTFHSKGEYENARGDKWWRPGDLSGKLVPWPVKDEQHARLNRN